MFNAKVEIVSYIFILNTIYLSFHLRINRLFLQGDNLNIHKKLSG